MVGKATQKLNLNSAIGGTPDHFSSAPACLENVVHRSALGLPTVFRTMVIEIPDDLRMTTIEKVDLPSGWHLFEHYPLTQAQGDAWIAKGETAVLKVPSSIIEEECNCLLNPLHKDFQVIKVSRTEPFVFDPCIKNSRSKLV